MKSKYRKDDFGLEASFRHLNYLSQEKSTKLKGELAKLKKARMKSKDKGFVMDSYQYEDQLKEEIKKIKSKKQYDPSYNAYGSFKSGCKRSYSNEHSFEPYGSGKVKCVLCGAIKKMKRVF